MKPLERIELTQSLYNASVVDYKPRYSNETAYSPTYFTVSKDNTVDWTKVATQTAFPNIFFTLICTCRHFQHYGCRIDMDLVAVLDENGGILEKIQLSNWKIREIVFQANHYDNSRLVRGATFELISQLPNTPYLVCVFDGFITFQELWDYFNALDVNCNTIKEGEFYIQYLIQRKQSLQANLTLEEYKTQINQNLAVINNHNTLFERIEKLLEKTTKGII